MRGTHITTRLVGAALLLSAVALTLPASAQDEAPRLSDYGAGSVDIYFLNSSGFLIRGGGKSVVIDGVLKERYSEYGALPAADYANLIAARSPFGKVDVTLVSHRHKDHFQPGAMGEFLAGHPDCILATSQDVLEHFKESNRDWGDFRLRVQKVEPARGRSRSQMVNGVQIEFLKLDHVDNSGKPVPNLGHIIHIGGKKVLHLGDAGKSSASAFRDLRLSSQRFDVALIPYWFFLDEEGLKVIEEHIHTTHIVAYHVPAQKVRKAIRRKSRTGIDIIVARMPMDHGRF